MEHLENEADADTASGVGCMVRFVWLVGHVAMLVIAGFIFRDDAKTLSLLSALFWGTALACVGLHYLEIKAFGASTMDGKPANVATWRRYTVRLVGLASLLWAGALLGS